jgi:hypothetical protein
MMPSVTWKKASGAKMLRRDHSTPFEKSVRKSLAASRGWPEYWCNVSLNEAEREFIASIGRLEGLARVDEMELSRVIKGLIVKLMAQHAELPKEKREASETQLLARGSEAQ